MIRNQTCYCSFCGKSEHEVLVLIAGPLVFICDECVVPCVEIVESHKAAAAPDHIMPPIQEPGPLEASGVGTDDLKPRLQSGYVLERVASTEIMPVGGRSRCEADCARHWTGVRNNNARLTAALKDSMVAIDDWLNTYASDMCDEERVKEARERIYNHGGTLAYIARIQQTNRAILKACGPLESGEGE